MHVARFGPRVVASNPGSLILNLKFRLKTQVEENFRTGLEL